MADGIFAKELEEELMKYTRKSDTKEERNSVAKTDEDPLNGEEEVNITECTKSVGSKLVETECQDTTESSSSFGDSSTGDENANALGDSEASSEFRGHAAPDFNGFGDSLRMRKKKLTTHWRSFAHPLMWRCKWVELKINMLQAQAQRYDRELEAYSKQKQTQYDNSTVMDGAKALPFSHENAKADVFKRKKRRRIEATADVAAYMSQHNLFSCFEDRKCLTGGAFTNYEPKNPGTHKIKTDDDNWGNDDLLSFEPDDGDNSLDHIISKIEFLQSQLDKMKSKAYRITRETAERISYAESLTLSPSHNENGIGDVSPQIMSLLAPQIAATSQSDLPITNGSSGQDHFGACGTVEDGDLIDNPTFKEEGSNFEEVKIDHPIQMPSELKDGSGHTAPTIAAEPDQTEEDQSTPKIRSIAKLTAPRSKRKRGRKKAWTSRRRRRSTG